jgi:hypothetical protein
VVDDAFWAVAAAVVALAESTVAVVRPLVSVVAAVLSVDAVADVSRRAAASVTQVTGVSAGAVGALPATELHSGASRLPMAVRMAVTGSRGAAVAVVTASLTAPTGSDTGTAAAPDCAAVPEVSVPDAFVVAADGAGVERASLCAPL